MPKKKKPEKKTAEKAYLFPHAILNGKQGISILASSTKEALEKLNKLLNAKADD